MAAEKVEGVSEVRWEPAVEPALGGACGVGDGVARKPLNIAVRRRYSPSSCSSSWSPSRTCSAVSSRLPGSGRDDGGTRNETDDTRGLISGRTTASRSRATGALRSDDDADDDGSAGRGAVGASRGGGRANLAEDEGGGEEKSEWKEALADDIVAGASAVESRFQADPASVPLFSSAATTKTADAGVWVCSSSSLFFFL